MRTTAIRALADYVLRMRQSHPPASREQRMQGDVAMTFENVRAIALELPGVVEASSHGARSFTVRKKLFLRLLADGETLVLRTDRFERDHLLSTAPAIFHVTSRIRGHPWVFARLAVAEPAQLRALVQDAWRRTAPRSMVDAFDAPP